MEEEKLKCMVVQSARNNHSPCWWMQSIDKHRCPIQLQAHSVKTSPQGSSRNHLEVMGHPEPANIWHPVSDRFLYLLPDVEFECFLRNQTDSRTKMIIDLETLWGVLGTFRGGFGGVEASLENPLSGPKIEGEKGELGPE